jgi:hypothetical protein
MLDTAPVVTLPLVVEVKPSSEHLSAYMIGALDAQDGEPFAPEMYFFWFGQMLEYTEGFESVKGENEITRSFKAQWPEREEAVEDDYTWIAQGGA